MTVFKTELLLTRDAFFSLENEWNDLLKRSDIENIFLTWEWLSTYLRSFDKQQTLWILVVRQQQDGYLMGVVPLLLQSRSVALGLTLKELSFIGSEVGSDHLDFILDKRYSDTIVNELSDFINEQEKPWDLIHLEGCRQSSIAYQVLQTLGHSVYHYPVVCPYLELPTQWDEYLQSLGKKRRYKIKAYRRKLEEAFPEQVSYQQINTQAELEASLADLFALHQQAQQAQGRNGAFADKTRQLFHREICRQFLAKDRLRLYFLKVNNKPIAMVYSFFYGGKVSFYTTGFDLQWSAHSPGQQIIYYVLEQLINEQAQEFDFLRGDESYKFMMTQTVREDQRLIMPRSYRGRLIAWAYAQKKSWQR